MISPSFKLMRCVAFFLLSSWLALPLSFAQINPSSFAQTNSLVSLVFAGDTTLDDDAGDLIAKGGDPFQSLSAESAQPSSGNSDRAPAEACPIRSPPGQ
jgi:hypothetical protein